MLYRDLVKEKKGGFGFPCYVDLAASDIRYGVPTKGTLAWDLTSREQRPGDVPYYRPKPASRWCHRIEAAPVSYPDLKARRSIADTDGQFWDAFSRAMLERTEREILGDTRYVDLGGCSTKIVEPEGGGPVLIVKGSAAYLAEALRDGEFRTTVDGKSVLAIPRTLRRFSDTNARLTCDVSFEPSRPTGPVGEMLGPPDKGETRQEFNLDGDFTSPEGNCPGSGSEELTVYGREMECHACAARFSVSQISAPYAYRLPSHSRFPEVERRERELLESLNSAVTAAIWQAQELDSQRRVAREDVAALEHQLAEAQPDSPEGNIAQRGEAHAEAKAETGPVVARRAKVTWDGKDVTSLVFPQQEFNLTGDFGYLTDLFRRGPYEVKAYGRFSFRAVPLRIEALPDGQARLTCRVENLREVAP